jgi:hypothetical protein
VAKLIRVNNKLLLVGKKLAASTKCCCVAPKSTCCCPIHGTTQTSCCIKVTLSGMEAVRHSQVPNCVACGGPNGTIGGGGGFYMPVGQQPNGSWTLGNGVLIEPPTRGIIRDCGYPDDTTHPEANVASMQPTVGFDCKPGGLLTVTAGAAAQVVNHGVALAFCGSVPFLGCDEGQTYTVENRVKQFCPPYPDCYPKAIIDLFIFPRNPPAYAGTATIQFIKCPIPCPSTCKCCDSYSVTVITTGCAGIDGTPIVMPRASSCLWVGPNGKLQCVGAAWIMRLSDSTCGGGYIEFQAENKNGCAPTDPKAWKCTHNDFGGTSGPLIVEINCASSSSCATDCAACQVIANALSISQTGVGVNGWDESLQVDIPGVCPLNASDGQLSATLECPSGDKWRLITYTADAGPTGPHITYEESPQADGCPPDTFTHVTENTVPGSGASPVATIDT